MNQAVRFDDGLYILDDGRVREFLVVGSSEALLIDTGFGDSHVLEAVRAVTDLPVRVALTHGDIDHAGGLEDFGACLLHEGDWHLIPDGISLRPLHEGDLLPCGPYRFEVIEIPGHTYGSVAFFDREKKLLLSGDSVQKEGPIYMFGGHRNLDLYIASQQKLLDMADQFETILPSHHDYPVDPGWIEKNLKDAIALREGRLAGSPHPSLPCRVCRGEWTEFYAQ